MVQGAAEKEWGLRNILPEAVAFLARWGVWFLVGWTLLSPLEGHLQAIETSHVRTLLDWVGIETTSGAVAFQFFMNGKLIEISPLCAGLLEMVLLSSAILSTRNEKWGSRIRGVVVGVLVLYVFNLLRMTITLLQLEHTSLSFAVITHDYLFRMVLLVGFALLYGGWLNRTSIRKWLHQKGFV